MLGGEPNGISLHDICRKLRLRPRDRLLDIGCGWGALILHAASHHGARCVGITLSLFQAEVARERLRIAGLNGHCRGKSFGLPCH